MYKRRSVSVGRYTYYVQFRDSDTHAYLPGKSRWTILDTLALDPEEFPPSSKAASREVAYRWLRSGKNLSVPGSVTTTMLPEVGP
ncbi:MAG: hypothetical protein ACOYM2_06240 [Rectinemataceae bacterium]